jgi:hypothetical protein
MIRMGVEEYDPLHGIEATQSQDTMYLSYGSEWVTCRVNGTSVGTGDAVWMLSINTPSDDEDDTVSFPRVDSPGYHGMGNIWVVDSLSLIK